MPRVKERGLQYKSPPKIWTIFHLIFTLFNSPLALPKNTTPSSNISVKFHHQPLFLSPKNYPPPNFDNFQPPHPPKQITHHYPNSRSHISKFHPTPNFNPFPKKFPSSPNHLKVISWVFCTPKFHSPQIWMPGARELEAISKFPFPKHFNPFTAPFILTSLEKQFLNL